MDNKRKQRSKRKQRRFIIFVSVVLSLLMAITLTVLSLTVFFTVKNIEVTGDYREGDYAAIIEKSKILTGGNLFMTATKQAPDIIKKEFPYIDEVKIKRKLFSTIVIDVKEVLSFAQIRMGNDYYAVNPSYKVVEISEGKPMKGYHVIMGMTLENPEIGEKSDVSENKYTELLDNIRKELDANGFLEKTTLINFITETSIEITYDNKIVFEIGSTSNLDLKIKTAKEVMISKEKANDDRSGIFELSNVSPNSKNKPNFSPAPLGLNDKYIADVLK